MPRLLFEKTGNAVWISHLDLMRLFQRAFKRAGLPLTHTQGYNPRPSVSIALPLSVGIESHCELLDFDLDGVMPADDEIRDRLNHALIAGIRVLEVYTGGRKIRELALLRSKLILEYDRGVPGGSVQALNELFSRKDLLVEKKTKNGNREQDIMSMIRSIRIYEINDSEISIEQLACCQNPTLNPMQVAEAIKIYTPQLSPDFVRCCREEIYDSNSIVFR